MAEIIDYFAFVGTYPFGAPGAFGLEALLGEMDAQGVGFSFVTDMGAVFLKEPTNANVALARACAAHADRVAAVPVIDLSTGRAGRAVAGLHEDWGVRGVRIAPNYHGYVLDAPTADALLGVLDERALMLFCAREIEDTRFQPPCLGVAPLALDALAPILSARVPVILNNYGPAEIEAAAEWPANVRLCVSAFDKPFGGLERLVERFGAGRFVFGSHTPFLYAGAVRANLAKSFLCETDVRTILSGGGARDF